MDIELDSESGSANIRVSTEEGDIEVSSGENAKLPEGMPEDIPIYPDMKISLSQRQSQDNAYSVIGVSQEASDKVAAWYKKEAAAQGWSETSSQEMDMGTMKMHTFAFEKDGRQLSVNVMRQEGATQIQIVTQNN